MHDASLYIWGSSLWNYDSLKQKDCNVMSPPVLMRRPLLKTIAETAGLCKFFQDVVQETQGLPLSMTLGCASSLPKLLFVQETFIRDCDMLDRIPGNEAIRNAWVGISVWGAG